MFSTHRFCRVLLGILFGTVVMAESLLLEAEEETPAPLRQQNPKAKSSEKPRKTLDYQIPQGWQKRPAGPIAQGSYEITQGKNQAKVTIAALRAATFDLLPKTINRWRMQIDLPIDEAEEEILEAATPITIDKHQGFLVDLHNPKSKQRILAAIVKHGDQDWYFKMRGEETLVEKERNNFKAFLKTVKFPEKGKAKTDKSQS